MVVVVGLVMSALVVVVVAVATTTTTAAAALTQLFSKMQQYVVFSRNGCRCTALGGFGGAGAI